MTFTSSDPRRVVLLLSASLLILAYLYNQEEMDPWMKKALAESAERMSGIANAPNELANWPPQVGESFPAIALVDHEGTPISVEAWKGKPTLIELVAMTCAGCQAFSGGLSHGGYQGFASQGGIESIEKYYNQYSGGHELFSGEINFAQIIIYNLRLEPARPEDLRGWRHHFGFDQHPTAQILTGGKPLANQASFRMIPGFILLDRDLVVQYDATGHSPRHNLYTELLPNIGSVLARVSKREPPTIDQTDRGR